MAFEFHHFTVINKKESQKRYVTFSLYTLTIDNYELEKCLLKQYYGKREKDNENNK